MKRPPVAIVGAGRVGCALGRALARAGWPVVAVSCRTAASTRRASRFVGAPGMPAREAAALANVVLLSVPDDEVDAAAREIAPALRRGTIVVHTSGALDSRALAACTRHGAKSASLHPLMTFPTPAEGLKAMKGAYFFFEGDPGTAPVLKALVRSVGGIPVPVARRAKILYHAGAVLACNALVALLSEALDLFSRAGVPASVARRAVGPLVRRTVENVLALGPARALTGPVARGDAGTVARHLDALPASALPVYRALGAATLRIARLPADRRRALASLLLDR